MGRERDVGRGVEGQTGGEGERLRERRRERGEGACPHPPSRSPREMDPFALLAYHGPSDLGRGR